jgi:diacylglycerol kinase family enzyme
VRKSKRAGKLARQAWNHGAEVIFVWGGDRTVRRCIDALAGTDATIAIVPAGTANLLATNLGSPRDNKSAVEIGL